MKDKMSEMIAEWRAREQFWNDAANTIPVDSSRWPLAVARANCFGLCAEELARLLEAEA